MKLNEITNHQHEYPPFLTKNDEVEKWLMECANGADDVDGQYHEILSAGTINYHRGLVVYNSGQDINDRQYNGRLACRFGRIEGSFDIDDLSLATLEGCPTFVNGFFSCVRNNLTSFKYAPKHVDGTFRAQHNEITSFIGIETYINHMRSLSADWHKIETGGIGLILIDGLTTLLAQADVISPPFKIIEKYLGRPGDIFECQMELIEAGYEAYAQL